MAIALLDLPYESNALEPHISARTIDFHYNRHHAGYVTNVNRLIMGSSLETADLLSIVKTSFSEKNYRLYNNAAQAWNHDFFWHSMRPDGGKSSATKILSLIDRDFGSYDSFEEEWIKKGTGLFGSGWVWLVQDSSGKLAIDTSTNADTPIVTEKKPLLTMDVWEHAHYLDYQNRRKDFIEAFLGSLINWEFAESKL